MNIYSSSYTLLLIFAYTSLLLAILVTCIKKTHYKNILHVLFKKHVIYVISVICYISLSIFVSVLILSFFKDYPLIPITLLVSGSLVIVLTCFVFTTILIGWAYAYDDFMEIMAYKTQNDMVLNVKE